MNKIPEAWKAFSKLVKDKVRPTMDGSYNTDDTYNIVNEIEQKLSELIDSKYLRLELISMALRGLLLMEIEPYQGGDEFAYSLWEWVKQ